MNMAGCPNANCAMQAQLIATQAQMIAMLQQQLAAAQQQLAAATGGGAEGPPVAEGEAALKQRPAKRARLTEGALVLQLPALTFGHCGAGVLGRGTDTCSGGDGGAFSSAVGAQPLDPSNGPVLWKATILELSNAMLGVTGNAQVGDAGYSDPTTFCWMNNGNIYTAGKTTSGQGGWVKGNLAAGDVCVFKLEAHQLSLRVQRLGAQTFTVPTNGVPNLRVFACLHSEGNRVQLSRAEPGEEY